MGEFSKIFTDVILDYQKLKFVFEYGFGWDDRIVNHLYGKSSQNFRELGDVLLKGNLKDHYCYEPWSKYREKKSGKGQRKVVRNNHYRLNQGLWFLGLYRCWGQHEESAAETEKIEKCLLKGEIYSQCDTQKCFYGPACRINEELMEFTELVRNGKTINRNIRKNYKDILTGKDGDRLIENKWTLEHMVPSCLKDEKEYESFLEMLRFFAAFSPLSVLGGNFLRRLTPEETSSLFFVRNQFPDFALEQESVFRCLYAMDHGLDILYEDKRYTPIRLYYKDRNMSGIESHLYLLAGRYEDGKEQILEELPLYNGKYIIPDKRSLNRDRKYEEDDFPEEEKRKFQIVFYSNDIGKLGEITEYLERRREGPWRQFETSYSRRTERIFMESPYYPGNKIWKAEQVTYEIEERDADGFLTFVKSFGDFACCMEQEEKQRKSDPPKPDNGRSKIREYQSLLSIYNSEKLLEKAGKKCLPPRLWEVRWLWFILNNYPEFCEMFLEADSLKRLKDKILSESFSEKDALWEKQYDYAPRVFDLGKRYGGAAHSNKKGTLIKYRQIIDVIRCGDILESEFGDDRSHIFPYALEYDVMRHAMEKCDEPIKIMCYNLDEKRNILISPKNVRIRGTRKSKREHCFSRLDKLYHILAYALRCGMSELQEIEPLENEILEILWKPDARGGDNYNRCVRKKLKKVPVYTELYERYRELCRKYPSDEAKHFLERVFKYWNDKEEDEGKADQERRYQAFLLHFFIQGFECLWGSRQGSRLADALDRFPDDRIWELISGPAQGQDSCENKGGGMINEIAFYNENLKNAVVSFTLFEADEKKIDLVYQLFGSFLCIGETEENQDIRFTVTYEKFAYRRVHMGLVALGSRIGRIDPPETAEVICKRMENVRRRHYEEFRFGNGCGENRSDQK